MEETRKYVGRISRAKDAILVESELGDGRASLGCPADFVESCLEEYADGQSVELEITVRVKKQNKQSI